MDDFTLPYEPETVDDDIENHKRTILHFDIDCFYAQVSKYFLSVGATVFQMYIKFAAIRPEIILILFI